MNNSIRKPYEKPKIIHESKLEVRAGSVITFDILADPLLEATGTPMPLPVDDGK